jgi:transposase
MEVVHGRCCGLDVHKRTVVACLLTPGPGGAPRKEVRTFGTMTEDLLALAEWLAAAGCTHVGMESTGVYWQPIWNVLEGRFTLLLANARHIKQVPGRKTDVRDCEWLAQLLRHGLLPPSHVPGREQRDLRELTRYRTALVQERTAEVNRLQKTLEGANLKLAAVTTKVLGKSGRAILDALLAGTTDPAVLAELAQGKLRAKLPQLERALAGSVGPHHHFLLARQLAHIDDLDGLIAEVSAEIAERTRPFEPAVERLDTIPGVGRRIAEIVLAEVGPDLAHFPSARHLASWAGMCPGNHESAGKRHSGKTRKGSPWLRAGLVEAAHAAGRTKGTYLRALYERVAARRGRKRAAVAVAHSILVIMYYVLTRETTYAELGANYFDERDRTRVEHRLVHRLERLGYKVSLEPRVA